MGEGEMGNWPGPLVSRNIQLFRRRGDDALQLPGRHAALWAASFLLLVACLAPCGPSPCSSTQQVNGEESHHCQGTYPAPLHHPRCPIRFVWLAPVPAALAGECHEQCVTVRLSFLAKSFMPIVTPNVGCNTELARRVLFPLQLRCSKPSCT
jgi:hypothetical protein